VARHVDPPTEQLIALWHARLGHVGSNRLFQVLRALQLPLADVTLSTVANVVSNCVWCIMGKMTQTPLRSVARKPISVTLPGSLGCIDMITSFPPGQSPSSIGVNRKPATIVLHYIDFATRLGFVSTLSSRDEFWPALQNIFVQMNAIGARGRLHPYQIMCDRAPEFLTRDVLQHLAELNIAVIPITSYSSRVNGVVENQNRQIQNLARTTLLQSEVPQSLWPYAIQYARLVLNSTHTRATGTSPHHRYTGEEPVYTHFRPFGCAVLLHTHGPGRLEPRAQQGVNLGPAERQGHYVLSIETRRIKVGRSLQFQEHRFPFKRHSLSGPHHPTRASLSPIAAQPTSDSRAPFKVDTPARSPPKGTCSTSLEGTPVVPPTTLRPRTRPPTGRVRAPVKRYDPTEIASAAQWASKNKASSVTQRAYALSGEDPGPPRPPLYHCVGRGGGPPVSQTTPTPSICTLPLRGGSHASARETSLSLTVSESQRNRTSIGTSKPSIMPCATTGQFNKLPSEQKELWKPAIETEAQNLLQSGCILAVPRKELKGQLLTGALRFTLKQPGNKPKVRLVVMGNLDRVSYEDTYAATISAEMVRLILTISVENDWEYHTLDVKAAFLNAKLETPRYMRPVPGMEHLLGPDQIFRVSKALYGLKISPKLWNDTVTKTLLNLGLTQVVTESTLFYMKAKEKLVVLLGIFVDDILVTGEEKYVRDVMDKFSKEYTTTSGNDNHYLGMRILRVGKTLQLDMSEKIERLLLAYEAANWTGKRTPLPITLNIESPSQDELDDKDIQSFPYRELIGSLNYIAIMARYDILFAVSKLASYCNSFGRVQIKALQHLMAYLSETRDFRLTIRPEGLKGMKLQAMVDASLGTCPETRRSTTGYLIYIGSRRTDIGFAPNSKQGLQPSAILAAKAKRQSIVSNSSAQAEKHALHTVCQRLIAFQHVLDQLGYDCNEPATVHIDAQAVIDNVKRGRHMTQATKHWSLILQQINEYTQPDPETGRVRIKLEKIPADLNIADELTKALPQSSHFFHVSLMFDNVKWL